MGKVIKLTSRGPEKVPAPKKLTPQMIALIKALAREGAREDHRASLKNG